MVTYGRFKFLNLTDMDWANEMALTCPVNKLGTGISRAGWPVHDHERAQRIQQDVSGAVRTHGPAEAGHYV